MPMYKQHAHKKLLRKKKIIANSLLSCLSKLVLRNTAVVVAMVTG